MKKYCLILLVFIMPLVGIGCTKSEKSDNEVIIGFDNTYFPMGFMNENGDTVGFDIDLARETFKRLNMNVVFQPIDWSMKETELNTGNIDIIWNGYTLTQERKQQVSYTDSYMKNKQLIITLSNSEIKNKSDLNNKSVGTQQGSSSLEAIEKDTKLVNSLQGKKPILYDTFDKVFRDLELGRIDAIVADETLSKYYINKKGEEKYKVLEDNFGEENYVVAFRKNDALRDKVNNTITELKEDNTFNEIYNKWFGSNN